MTPYKKRRIAWFAGIMTAFSSAIGAIIYSVFADAWWPIALVYGVLISLALWLASADLAK